MSTSGDAPLEHDETTTISKDWPLVDSLKETVLGEIEPYEQIAVPNRGLFPHVRYGHGTGPGRPGRKK